MRQGCGEESHSPSGYSWDRREGDEAGEQQGGTSPLDVLRGTREGDEASE